LAIQPPKRLGLKVEELLLVGAHLGPQIGIGVLDDHALIVGQGVERFADNAYGAFPAPFAKTVAAIEQTGVAIQSVQATWLGHVAPLAPQRCPMLRSGQVAPRISALIRIRQHDYD